MKIRHLFRCDAVIEDLAELRPVVGDAAANNGRFFDAASRIALYLRKEALDDAFQVGRHYRITVEAE